MKFIGRHLTLSSLKADLKHYDINAAQVFTKAPQQWFGKTLTCGTINYSKDKYYICAHAGYLINLANRESNSRDALLHEAKRCEYLGIPDLVVHPGSGYKADVIRTLLSYGNEWPSSVRLLLENTAGQGKYLGGELSELENIINNCALPLGICYDTAHAWGHGNNVEKDLEHQMIKLIHLNDSAVPFGSKKDRHANLGYGTMPALLFKHIADTVTVPCIMETPEPYAKEDLNAYKNLHAHAECR